LSTLTLVRVAVVRRFVEMSWTCRPWAPGVRGCRAVDSGGPPPGPPGRRSVPFNGPRHSRARNVIRVPHCRRTVIPQHGSHYPAGTPPRPRPGNGFTSHSVARHRVRRREVGTRVGQRAGVRSGAGTGGFRPGPAQSPPKTDMPTCRWPTPTEQPVFSTSRSTPTNSPEPSSPNSNKPYPQMFEKTCIANGSGNPRV